MDDSLSHTFFQEVVPIVAVGLAGAWLVRRWVRPSQASHRACAACEQVTASPTAQVTASPTARHRLTVLR